MANEMGDLQVPSEHARLSQLFAAANSIRKHRQTIKKTSRTCEHHEPFNTRGKEEERMKDCIAACDEGVQNLQRLLSMHAEKAAWSSMVQQQILVELRKKEAECGEINNSLCEAEMRHRRQLHQLGRERKDLLGILHELHRHLEPVPRFQPLLRKLNLAAKIKQLKEASHIPVRKVSPFRPCTGRSDTVISHAYQEEETEADEKRLGPSSSAMPWESLEKRCDDEEECDPVNSIDDAANSYSQSGFTESSRCEGEDREEKLLNLEQKLLHSQCQVQELEAKLQQERSAFDRLWQTYQHRDSCSRVRTSVSTNSSPEEPALRSKPKQAGSFLSSLLSICT